MKTGKKPCGCHIERIGHMPAVIVFCPMHEAAEERLEAAGFRIKELETTYGAKWLQDHQYLDWLSESNKANAILCQRIEAAETDLTMEATLILNSHNLDALLAHRLLDICNRMMGRAAIAGEKKA